MAHSIRDIATALGAEAAGDLTLTVTHASEPQAAGTDALALAMSPKYAEALPKGRAQAAHVFCGRSAFFLIFAMRSETP